MKKAINLRSYYFSTHFTQKTILFKCNIKITTEWKLWIGEGLHKEKYPATNQNNHKVLKVKSVIVIVVIMAIQRI